MRTSGSGPESGALSIIYLAMGGGVALFAAVLVFLRLPPSVGSATPFRVAWLVVALGVALASGALRTRAVASGADREQRNTMAIFVWALGEGQAFLGLIGYMLTGDRLLLLLPVVFFAWLWLRYPPGAFRGRR